MIFNVRGIKKLPFSQFPISASRQCGRLASVYPWTLVTLHFDFLQPECQYMRRVVNTRSALGWGMADLTARLYY
jgi:hypothetical protein